MCLKCFLSRDAVLHTGTELLIFAAHHLVRVFEEAADKQLLFQAVEATSLPWWMKQMLLDALTLKTERDSKRQNTVACE